MQPLLSIRFNPQKYRSNYQPWTNLGKTLLVGEGNLSFSIALLDIPSISKMGTTTTTYEAEEALDSKTTENALSLRHEGITVLHGVDATKLHKILFNIQWKGHDNNG